MTKDERQQMWTRRVLLALFVFMVAWGVVFVLALNCLSGWQHMLPGGFASATLANQVATVVFTVLSVAGAMLGSSILAVPLALLHLGMNAMLWRVGGIRPIVALAFSFCYGMATGYVWFLWWRQDRFFSFQDINYNTPPLAVPAWIACASAGLVAGLFLARPPKPASADMTTA